MRLLGLTGGIGAGKSTAAEWLRQQGIPVVDTDDLARAVVEPGAPALEEIRREFGAEVIGADGRLLREVLAARVFSDPAARQRLEAITHPAIRSLWEHSAREWRQQAVPVGVVVIPLLYETGAQVSFSQVVCLACSAESQRERLAARGWSAEHMARRLEAQLPMAEKMRRADFVIWTEGPREVSARQLARVLAGQGS